MAKKRRTKEERGLLSPLSARVLWAVGLMLGLGAVACLVGLVATDSGRPWAIVAYGSGLLAATATFFLLVALVARRRRVVFGGELAAETLRRLRRRASLDEAHPNEFTRRLAREVEAAEGLRRSLVEAEAYEQARELGLAVLDARDLLAESRGPGELP